MLPKEKETWSARQEDWTLNQTGNWAGYDVTENGSAVLNQTRENNKANEITGIATAPEQTQWVQPGLIPGTRT